MVYWFLFSIANQLFPGSFLCWVLIDLGYGHRTCSAVRCGALLASWREHGCFCLAGCPVPQPAVRSVGQAALVSGSVVLPGLAPWVPSWSSVTEAHGLLLRIRLLMPAPWWAQVRYQFSKLLSSPLSFPQSPQHCPGASLPCLSTAEPRFECPAACLCVGLIGQRMARGNQVMGTGPVAVGLVTWVP